MNVNDLSVKGMDELSLVFRNHDGQSWQQRNQDAIVLVTKGGPEADARKAKSFLGDLWDKVMRKGAPAPAGEPAPKAAGDDLATTIAENAAGYAAATMSWDALASLIGQINWDLQMIFTSGDAFTDEEKTVAVQRTLEAFVSAAQSLLPMLLGNVEVVGMVEKAGARHSKSDMAKLGKMVEHADAIKSLHSELTASAVDDETPVDKGATSPSNTATPAPIVEAVAEAPKAEATAVEQTPPAVAPVSADAIATLLKGQLDAFGAELQQSVTAQLATHAKAVGERLAEVSERVEKGATAAPEPSAIERTVAAIKAAQQPTSPGASPTMDATFEMKGNALVEQPPVQHDGSVRGIIKASRLSQA